LSEEIKEVTILGLGPSRIAHPISGEVWGLNGVYKNHKDLSLIFFMHDEDIHTYPKHHNVGTIEDAKALGLEIINLDNYPIKAICDEFGLPYFTSTPAYMIALAIFRGYKIINLVGIDYLPSDETHKPMKACVEAWCGIAIRSGCHISIAEGSAVLKPDKGCYNFYGYEVDQLTEKQLA